MFMMEMTHKSLPRHTRPAYNDTLYPVQQELSNWSGIFMALGVLGIDPRALCILGKYYSPEIYSPAIQHFKNNSFFGLLYPEQRFLKKEHSVSSTGVSEHHFSFGLGQKRIRKVAASAAAIF